MKYRAMRGWTLLAAVGLITSACATITHGVDPQAREAGVTNGARVILYGSRANIDGLRIYQGDSKEPLKIVMVPNPTFGQAVGNAVRQSAAQAQANQTGSASYTQSMRYSPAIYLKHKGTKTLRLVRTDGAEATVVTKSHVGMRYVIIDWLLFAPTIGLSLGIDWATGKWNMYDSIEIDRYFTTAAGSR